MLSRLHKKVIEALHDNVVDRLAAVACRHSISLWISHETLSPNVHYTCREICGRLGDPHNVPNRPRRAAVHTPNSTPCVYTLSACYSPPPHIHLSIAQPVGFEPDTPVVERLRTLQTAVERLRTLHAYIIHTYEELYKSTRVERCAPF